MYSILIASLFACAAFAAPTESNPIPTEDADLVSFVARVTKQRTSGAPLNLDNYVFSYAHVGAGIDQALLVANDTNLVAPRFVQNGTTEDITYGNGYVESYPPSNNITYGVVIRSNDTAGSNGTHFVGVDAGSGSKGVGVRFPYTGVVFPEDQPVLGYQNTTEGGVTYGNQFYACEGTLYTNPVIDLFWRDEYATTPDNCTEVVLFAQCAGNVTDEYASSYHTVQKSPCYPDASWVPYTGNQ